MEELSGKMRAGHWIIMHDGEYYCDRCNCESPNNEKWDYCPNCGAIMVKPARNDILAKRFGIPMERILK